MTITLDLRYTGAAVLVLAIAFLLGYVGEFLDRFVSAIKRVFKNKQNDK